MALPKQAEAELPPVCSSRIKVRAGSRPPPARPMCGVVVVGKYVRYGTVYGTLGMGGVLHGAMGHGPGRKGIGWTSWEHASWRCAEGPLQAGVAPEPMKIRMQPKRLWPLEFCDPSVRRVSCKQC